MGEAPVNLGDHATMVEALRRPRTGIVVPRSPTEAECQRTLVEAAQLAGWLVAHFRPARTGRGIRTPIQGDAGFPDLVLARRSPPWRVIVVELKRRPNRASAAQQLWLDALAGAGVDARLAWMPDELDDLVAELAAGAPCHDPPTTKGTIP
jgi:hypothetical protein